MSRPLRALITNDDGIAAPGLRWLAWAAVDHGLDVVVAAPNYEASGSSASMTAVTQQGRVVFQRRELPQLADVPAYAVAGSPGYIVVLATLGAFGSPPDLVLSGINRGANAGHAVVHSGTVGAALTAAGNGRRAIAVSLDVLSAGAGTASSGGAAVAELDRVDDEARHWGSAARLVRDLLPKLVEAPEGTVFNLNVPDVPAERLRGVRRAALARFGQVELTIAEVGEGFVRTAVEESRVRLEPGTDLACLANGYASVTPISAVVEARDLELDL
jgi:5'-nucleotidase